MAARELLPLSLYNLLASNRGGLFLVYFPIYLIDARGASVGTALALVSGAYVAASLVGPVAGRWSDRVGRRRPFLLGAEVATLPLFVAIPFAPNYLVAGALFIGANVTLAFGSPALNAYVADVTRESERGAGFGLLNASQFGGGIVGFLVVGIAVSLGGFWTLFAFVGVVMVGTISVVLFLVPEAPAVPSSARAPWREYRPLVTFSTAVSIRALGMGAVGAFYGAFATALGATPLDVSLLAIVGLVTATLVAVPFGRYVDRRGEIRGIWYGTLVSLAGIGFFAVAARWELLLPGQSLRYAGMCLLSPGMLAWVARIAPTGHRAEYQGIFSLVNSTLWSLGPFAGGIAFDLGGSPALFGFAIGATAVSLMAIEWLYVARGRRAAAVPPPEAARAPPATGAR